MDDDTDDGDTAADETLTIYIMMFTIVQALIFFFFGKMFRNTSNRMLIT